MSAYNYIYIVILLFWKHNLFCVFYWFIYFYDLQILYNKGVNAILEDKSEHQHILCDYILTIYFGIDDIQLVETIYSEQSTHFLILLMPKSPIPESVAWAHFQTYLVHMLSPLQTLLGRIKVVQGVTITLDFMETFFYIYIVIYPVCFFQAYCPPEKEKFLGQPLSCATTMGKRLSLISLQAKIHYLNSPSK